MCTWQSTLPIHKCTGRDSLFKMCSHNWKYWQIIVCSRPERTWTEHNGRRTGSKKYPVKMRVFCLQPTDSCGQGNGHASDDDCFCIYDQHICIYQWYWWKSQILHLGKQRIVQRHSCTVAMNSQRNYCCVHAVCTTYWSAITLWQPV